MMQDKSKKLLSEIVHQKHMQKQPVKAAIETCGPNKHPQCKSAIHGTAKSVSAEEPRGKQSSNHYCT